MPRKRKETPPEVPVVEAPQTQDQLIDIPPKYLAHWLVDRIAICDTPANLGYLTYHEEIDNSGTSLLRLICTVLNTYAGDELTPEDRATFATIFTWEALVRFIRKHFLFISEEDLNAALADPSKLDAAVADRLNMDAATRSAFWRTHPASRSVFVQSPPLPTENSNKPTPDLSSAPSNATDGPSAMSSLLKDVAEELSEVSPLVRERQLVTDNFRRLSNRASSVFVDFLPRVEWLISRLNEIQRLGCLSLSDLCTLVGDLASHDRLVRVCASVFRKSLNHTHPLLAQSQVRFLYEQCLSLATVSEEEFAKISAQIEAFIQQLTTAAEASWQFSEMVLHARNVEPRKSDDTSSEADRDESMDEEEGYSETELERILFAFVGAVSQISAENAQVMQADVDHVHARREQAAPATESTSPTGTPYPSPVEYDAASLEWVISEFERVWRSLNTTPNGNTPQYQIGITMVEWLRYFQKIHEPTKRPASVNPVSFGASSTLNPNGMLPHDKEMSDLQRVNELQILLSRLWSNLPATMEYSQLARIKPDLDRMIMIHEILINSLRRSMCEQQPNIGSASCVINGVPLSDMCTGQRMSWSTITKLSELQRALRECSNIPASAKVDAQMNGLQQGIQQLAEWFKTHVDSLIANSGERRYGPPPAGYNPSDRPFATPGYTLDPLTSVPMTPMSPPVFTTGKFRPEDTGPLIY